MDFDVVLFDLGGVLVRLGGVEAMQHLAGIESEEELWHRWLTCRWVRRFERGLCSSGDFANGVVDDWGLTVTPEEFIEQFGAWPEGLFDGAEQLVQTTSARARVGCVSNTNALHWSEVASMGRLMDLFEVTFLSHELGLVKPDRELFDHVSEALGVPAHRIIFLDDNAVNVAQATSAGFTAVQVRGVDEAASALVTLGLLTAHGA